MRFFGIVLAAGSGTRYGRDKVWEPLFGAPVWLHSYRALFSPPVEAVGIVVAPGSEQRFRALAKDAAFVVAGGATRTASLAAGLGAMPAGYEAVLVHDAARPFCPPAVVARVAAAVERDGAAYPVVSAVDTVRLGDGDGTTLLDRSKVLLAQTPQGARVEDLRRAVLASEASDEAAMLESIGIRASAVEGDPMNRKVTFDGDLPFPTETRTGIGYDSHRFSDDPERPLWLGGIQLPGPGLAGHSDADAVLHALTDALLGAAALGDIGSHFPDTDPQWKDARSDIFLAAVANKLREDGWYIVSTDVTVITETPKLEPHRAAMQQAIAQCLGIAPDQVGIKATTNEGMGAIGRGEGVACLAVATVSRSRR